MNKCLFKSFPSNVFAALLLLLVSFAPMYANADPTFVNGPAYTIPGNVCQNSNGVDLTQYFHISDVDAALPLTITIYAIPDRCGSVNITDGTATSGSTDITPSGSIVYIPSIGFTGTEHFTLIVSDGTLSDTVNVAVNVSAVTASVTAQTNVTCNGSNNGSATIAVSGPVGTLTYDWTPGTPAGDGTTTITGLTAGIYTVTATDGTGCEVTQEVTITEPAILNATASMLSAVSCNSGSNGAVDVSVTGGTTPYTYSWNGTSLATSSLGGLAAGNYTVIVTDNNNCADTDAVAVTEPTTITASITAHTDVLCNGGSTGTATADATGGTGTLSYSWSPAGGNAAVATGLSAGDYTVTVTDANSCTAQQFVTIAEPTAIAASIPAHSDAFCNGEATGSAVANATGGTGTLSYSWSPAGGNAALATGLSAGDYTVTVTDENSCAAQQFVTIAEPTAITATITAHTDVLCNGAATGTATADATGGTGTLLYSWAPAGGSAAVATGLLARDYMVTVTDANSCTAQQLVTIAEPAAIFVPIIAQTDVLCNGGSTGTATAYATGGTGTLSYSWSPAGGNAAVATGLSARDYMVTVTDANSCTAQQFVTIAEPTAITATITAHTDVLCNGGSTGTATADATGGTGTLSYSWSPAGGNAAVATGLSAGDYTVTVTDANSCTAQQFVTISEPTAIAASITAHTDVLCNGAATGTATADATGGTGILSYSWSPAGGNAAVATGLSAGNYTVTVTDANSCTAQQFVTISEPTAIAASITAHTDVLCNGAATGTATADATGGTGTLSYSWSPAGGNAAVATGLSAGDYTITVTDANSCTAQQFVTIAEPTAIAASITAHTDVLCNGGSTGTATADATGGTGTLSYSWSPAGGNAAVATGLSAGNYTVTVTDANSCTAQQFVTIAEPTAITASITAHTDVLCNGGFTGTATADATGGTGILSYSWSPAGGNAAVATGLSAGDYTVTVTDANSCAAQQFVTIAEPTAIAASIIAHSDVLCNGTATGAATADAIGGTGTLSYSWSPAGGNAAVATGLSAGDYMVTVTDANSCTAQKFVTIAEPTAITASITAHTDVLCNGGTTGTATADATGGTGTLSYSWSPAGGNAAVATGLSSGDYTVTVTDANSCTAQQFVTIVEPLALTADITASTNVLCNGGTDGSATVTAAGGTAPYAYQWNPTGGTAASATGLAAGSYTVVVTDLNSCSQQAVVSISEPAALNATASMLSAVSCNAGSNGVVDVSVTGGTTPYSYSWNGTSSATSSLGGLAAGNYTVIVTDNNNCADTDAVAITEPVAITASVSSQTNVLCRGNATGSATIDATGGTGAFTYSWSPSGGSLATATGLAAGDYTVTVQDANNCTAMQPVTITEPATGIFASVSSQANVSCNGLSNGSAEITATSPNLPLAYSWSPAGGSAAAATGLAAGTYTVTISDAGSCTYVQTVTITEPTVLTANITATTDVKCNGGNDGSATVNAAGGTAGYTYLWSDAAGTMTSVANGLTVGSYTVTVTDANSCTQTSIATINEPTVLTANTTASADVKCNGGTDGSATVTAAGGTPGYTYLWSDAAGTITSVANALTAGNYTVTVTDANSCTQTATTTINEPTAITANVTATTDVKCNGGNDGDATVTATGGTAPYTYSWSDAAATTLSVASGLTAGSYTVTVTDANNCMQTAVATINEPAILTANITATTDVKCNGGSNGGATVTATGGTAPYTYSWSDAAGTTSSVVSNLAIGSYTVTVTDANSCTQTAVATITEPTILAANISAATNVSCNAGSNGNATVTAIGGTAPYTYLWSDATATTSSVANNLAAGSYTVTVTDANSCTQTAVATITEPAILTVNITATTNVNCNGGANGSATVTAAGGTAGYTYLWSDAAATTSSAVSGLVAGSYTVTVTDANSCTQTAVATITEPTIITANVTATTNVSCNGGSNGSATVAAAGGTTGYTYLWSDAAATTSSVVTGLAAGSYTVTVTDANSCTQTAVATITEPTILTANISAITNVSCNGGTNGSATVTAAGGTTGYTYLWSDAAATTSSVVTGLAAGSYTVTVTDANSCTQTAVATITEPTVLTANISATTNVSCNGGTNGSATVTAAGGATGYTYLWSDAAATTSSVATGLIAGSYTVTVTDANSCTQTAVATLTEPTILTANMTATTDVSCNGGNNGSATVTATGGTLGSGYTYLWSDVAGTTSSVATGLAAGNYTVTVTDANSCSQTAVAVIGQPATYPSITAIGNNGPVCSGATLSLTSAAGGGTAPYTFSWSGPGGFTSTDANPSIGSAAVTATGVYSLIVTDVHACITATDTMSVLVNDLPVIVSAGSNSPVCAGVTLSLNVTATASGAITYSWTGSDGFTSTEQNPGVTTTAMSGEYTYTVVATGSGSCNTQSVFTATVNPLPHASAPADMAICNGASTTLISFGSDVAGSTFSWTNDNTSIGLAANGTGDIAAFTAVNTSTDPVTATIVVTPSANGCTGFNDTMVITVNPTPQLTTTLTPAAICDSTTFSYTPASLTAGTTYVWSRDVVAGISNPANADNTDPAEVLDNTTPNPVAVVYVYTLTANTCTNTQSVTVIVNPTPVFTSTLSPAAICNNTLFSYTPASATVGTTFAWSRDTMDNILNPSASGSDDPMETLVNVAPFPVNVTYVYTLTANGCAHTQSVQATVNPSALLSSTHTPASICDSAVFNYMPASLTSGTTYAWSRATVAGISNAAGTGTDNPMEVLYNTTADSIAVNYSYTLTAYGCTNTQSVQVYVKPTPKLSSTLTPAAICNNTIFNYTPASATGGAAFAWTRAASAGISTPANSGTGNPMEVLHNMTANPVTTRYVFTLSAAGCTHSQVVTARVNPTPALSGTTVGNLCSGAEFVYGPGSATTGTGFTWTRAAVPGITNAASSGADSIDEVLVNATNVARTVVYRYTLTANGCSNIQNVIISVEPAPAAPAIAIHPDASLCSHTMYQNFGAATPAPDTVNYTWAAVNAEVYAQGAGHTNALVSFPNSGAASVILMASINGYSCFAYDTFNVAVGTAEAPNADVYYIHDHFYYTDNTVSSYQWGYDDAASLDSVILAGQIDQNYFEGAPDFTNRKYWVMTTKDGCMSKSYYNAPVSVVNVNAAVAINLTVSPNPASNTVVVSAEGFNGGNDKVELTDMTGKLITTEAVANNKAQLNVAKLASGVYVVSYYHNGAKAGSTKVVKE